MQGLAYWRTDIIHGGDPAQIVAETQGMNCDVFAPKFGNGLTRWQGLEPRIEAHQEAGIEAHGWWYLKGLAGEGQAIGEHAVELGLDAILLDVETHWDNSNASADTVMDEIEAAAPDIPVGLCSWWKPSYHAADRYRPFLERCDFNAPQVYWIGRYYAQAGADVLDWCLEEYEDLYGFPAEKTYPVLAAFGQTYGSGHWWAATVEQMTIAQERAAELGLPGIYWYSADYMLGGAGSQGYNEQPEMIEALASFDWSDTSGETPDGDPDRFLRLADMRERITRRYQEDLAWIEEVAEHV